MSRNLARNLRGGILSGFDNCGISSRCGRHRALNGRRSRPTSGPLRSSLFRHKKTSSLGRISDRQPHPTAHQRGTSAGTPGRARHLTATIGQYVGPNHMQYWSYNSERGWTVHDHRVSSVSCPMCNGPAHRVPRRPIDRLLGRLFPQHRYQCESPDCQWKGNLPVPRDLK